MRVFHSGLALMAVGGLMLAPLSAFAQHHGGGAITVPAIRSRLGRVTLPRNRSRGRDLRKGRIPRPSGTGTTAIARSSTTTTRIGIEVTGTETTETGTGTGIAGTIGIGTAG